MDVKNGGNSGSSTMPKCISGQRWQLTGKEPATRRISSERNKLCAPVLRSEFKEMKQAKILKALESKYKLLYKLLNLYNFLNLLNFFLKCIIIIYNKFNNLNL